MKLTVYLAGQIHDDWRKEIKKLAQQKNLPVTFYGPMENHDRSDHIGEEILGEQPDAIFKDDAASSFNNLRTDVLLNKADIVIARFGSEFKQWNSAMDAGRAIALNKPLILIRPASLHHPLKEIARAAHVVCETAEQAVAALSYIFETE